MTLRVDLHDFQTEGRRLFRCSTQQTMIERSQISGDTIIATSTVVHSESDHAQHRF
jgi:hypothetical protein